MYEVGDIIWYIGAGGAIFSGIIFAVYRFIVFVCDDEGVWIDIDKKDIVKHKKGWRR